MWRQLGDRWPCSKRLACHGRLNQLCEDRMELGMAKEQPVTVLQR
jgi:hypothetical protein